MARPVILGSSFNPTWDQVSPQSADLNIPAPWPFFSLDIPSSLDPAQTISGLEGAMAIEPKCSAPFSSIGFQVNPPSGVFHTATEFQPDIAKMMFGLPGMDVNRAIWPPMDLGPM